MQRLPNAEQEAYEYLMEKIRDGSFAAGQRLIAEDIAAAIQVSRMPVRIAFRRLADEGFLELRQNRGVTVKGIAAKDIQEIFELRAVLEAHVFEVAIEILNEEDVLQIEMLYERMQRSIGDAERWVTNHRAFHEYLSLISQRKRFNQHISALHAFVEPHMREWIRHIMTMRGIENDHVEIMQAIKARKKKGAGELMRNHVMETVKYLEDVVM